jgi:hypothetical protein
VEDAVFDESYAVRYKVRYEIEEDQAKEDDQDIENLLDLGWTDA